MAGRPGRPPLDHPDVRRWAAAIAVGARAGALGGPMRLDVRLEPAGLELRAHDRYVSRRRHLTPGEVRRRLVELGIVVAMLLVWHGAMVLPCGER